MLMYFTDKYNHYNESWNELPYELEYSLKTSGLGSLSEFQNK